MRPAAQVVDAVHRAFGGQAQALGTPAALLDFVEAMLPERNNAPVDSHTPAEQPRLNPLPLASADSRPSAVPPPPPPVPPPPIAAAPPAPVPPPPPPIAPSLGGPAPAVPPGRTQPVAVVPPAPPPAITPASPPATPSRSAAVAVQRGNATAPPRGKSSSPAAVVKQPAAETGTFRPRRKRRWWRRQRQPLQVPVSAGALAADRSEKRKRMPAWLLSFIVHLVLLLILAAVPLRQLASGPLTLMFGTAGDPGLAEFELSGLDAVSETLPNEAELSVSEPVSEPGELLELKLPELMSAAKPPSAAEVPALSNLPIGISQGLSGRTGALKSELLSRFGGNAQTEDAVALGLKWLAKQQRSDGSWSLVGPYSEGGVSENATAATALALNAFLGAGSTHKEGEYRENVKLGLAWLVRRQSKEGYFPDPREPSRQQMYAQAIASITVTEAYGMTGDSEMRVPAERAMRFAAWSQSRLRGWRYDPREDADLSVTGWFLMALQTGRMAGLAVDEKALNNVTQFLDSVSHENKSRYAYTDFEPPSLSMTAEGLLCRIYLGWPRSHPALLRALQDDLLPAAPREDEREYSVYYWYYATQVLHHVGGEPWEQWNRAMRRTLPALQEKSGAEAGSWDPSGDAFGASGGRLYTTCLNLYCLEVYYRHLALYDLR